MASSSSSTNQDSESISNNDMNPSWTYDVFLSFCDKDTAKSFAYNLDTALTVAGIVVFRDDDKLRNQDQMITPSVLHAVERSRISIVVFSKNYADSTQCLQELEKIMECYGNMGQMVVPVFHNDVGPSNVRFQEGMLEEAFNLLAQRVLKKDESMCEDFDILGFDVDSRNESEDIKKVVEHVTSLLDRTDFFIADHPVGVDYRVQDVIQLLNRQESKDPLLIGICGMGGIGKTTIAKAVYNRIRHDFEANSFLLNVAKNWANRKVSLQQQLFADICKTKKITIDTVESVILILRKRLFQKKIFLVLDDVSELEQLNVLCGSPIRFGQGSKIIITSRDPSNFCYHDISHVYRMNTMNDDESLQLFSWHAFKQPNPMAGFADLSRDLIAYFGGVPLVLQVLGSFLLSRRSKTEWKSVLEKLKCIPNYNVGEKLIISYDGLRDNDMKAIFLDIASFFIGTDQEDATKILKDSGGHFVDNGMSVLVQQSLVTVDRKNKIEMHDLLKDMAREIINRKSQSVAKEKIYDVFLSFRGEDCRAKFISHLYTSLQNAGLYVFKDDDGIRKGDRISLSLMEAIGQSRICIVVLSRNYANSRWCMLELENIMGIGNIKGQVVIPVFYEVDPSEVRRQTGKFGEGFENLIKRISVDKYRNMNWKRALVQVGCLSGVVVINSRDESEDIRKVVNEVTKLLDRTDLFIADHPVGIESRVQDVIQLLNSQQSKDSLLIGIWGMGGIGKTTIAKAAYNKIRHDYEAKSFLLNVREFWEQDNGKVSLQQRLLSDIYKTTKIKIRTVESGKMILQERLSQKKIFLVLDDINKLDQLNALCGSCKWFGQGSRIIITTRDDDLLHSLKADHVYRMKTMNGNESLQLFSWHAFKEPSPIDGFADLSRDFIKYSGGLPLALQVIGSFLLTKRRKIEWKSVLEKLKLIPNDLVLEKLRISFDGLSDYDMKEIFLDIAFFFIGMDQEDVTKILEGCGHYAGIGIPVLVQRTLVTVDRKNKIGMHDLLQDMGREIVSKKSREGNQDPSRLWRYEDVNSVLSKDTRTLDVKGLTLKMSRMDSTTYLDSKTFEKMNKLKLLQLAGVQFNGDYNYLSRELRWLCWHGFPLKYTPADFHQERLVSIDLKYSNLERVWKKSQFLKGLKFLNLSHSHNLRQTPDFSNLPNLEKLILKDCPNLSSVSPSIGHLKKILLINLKDCTGLCELPRSIYKLESLKSFIVSGCTKIDKLEEDIEQMTSLTTLIADNTALTRVPFAVVRSKSIGYISLCGFKGSSRNVFPSIIQSWMSPTNGILSLVQTFAGTSSIEYLDEQNDSFYDLPSIYEELQNLQRLWLKCESDTQLNQTLASILDNLHTESCEELEAMQNIPQSSNFVTSASTHYFSQVRICSTQKSLASLLIQMGMNCHVTNTLREDILQKMPPNGSGLLPGDNYPDWLSFNENGSSVTFEVPQVDERSLKTIMCIVYSSPDDITSEAVKGLKVLLLINFTKKTIQLYKRDALLASFDEEEWQKVVSSTETGDIVKVIVVFESKIVVKKITLYLIYDEPIDEKTKHCPEPDKNILVSSGDRNSVQSVEDEGSTNDESSEETLSAEEDNDVYSEVKRPKYQKWKEDLKKIDSQTTDKEPIQRDTKKAPKPSSHKHTAPSEKPRKRELIITSEEGEEVEEEPVNTKAKPQKKVENLKTSKSIRQASVSQKRKDDKVVTPYDNEGEAENTTPLKRNPKRPAKPISVDGPSESQSFSSIKKLLEDNSTPTTPPAHSYPKTTSPGIPINQGVNVDNQTSPSQIQPNAEISPDKTTAELTEKEVENPHPEVKLPGQGENTKSDNPRDAELTPDNRQNSTVVVNPTQPQVITEVSSTTATLTSQIGNSSPVISNTSFNLEEIEIMKKKNPLEALRRFSMVRSAGVGQSPSSSTMSSSGLSGDSVTLLVQQLRSKVLDVDLFQNIEENPSIVDDIKFLITQLNQQALDNSVLHFILELEPLLDQATTSIRLRKESGGKLNQMNETMSQEMELTAKAQGKIDELEAQVKEDKDQLEAQVKEDKDQLEAFDKQIEDLQKQIEKLQEERANLENSKVAPVQEKIMKEASIGIEHMEKALALDKELETVVAKHSTNNTRVELARKRFEALKTQFPF